MNSTVIAPKPNNFVPAESVAYGETGNWAPNSDGTAVEEDLMNGVRSQYSSLIPKGGDLAVERPDNLDTPLSQPEIKFLPTEGNMKPLILTPVIPTLIPDPTFYTSNEMEKGVETYTLGTYGDNSTSGGVDAFSTNDQQDAMANAQYQGLKMDTPRVENIAAVSKENLHDFTGVEHPEGQIPGKADTKIIEGFAVKDISMTDSQKVEKKAVVPGLVVLAPPPAIDPATIIDTTNMTTTGARRQF